MFVILKSTLLSASMHTSIVSNEVLSFRENKYFQVCKFAMWLDLWLDGMCGCEILAKTLTSVNIVIFVQICFIR